MTCYAHVGIMDTPDSLLYLCQVLAQMRIRGRRRIFICQQNHTHIKLN